MAIYGTMLFVLFSMGDHKKISRTFYALMILQIFSTIWGELYLYYSANVITVSWKSIKGPTLVKFSINDQYSCIPLITQNTSKETNWSPTCNLNIPGNRDHCTHSLLDQGALLTSCCCRNDRFPWQPSFLHFQMQCLFEDQIPEQIVSHYSSLIIDKVNIKHNGLQIWKKLLLHWTFKICSG